jgi:hypothetical protein
VYRAAGIISDNAHQVSIENKREVLPQVCHGAFDVIVEFRGGGLLIHQYTCAAVLTHACERNVYRYVWSVIWRRVSFDSILVKWLCSLLAVNIVSRTYINRISKERLDGQ